MKHRLLEARLRLHLDVLQVESVLECTLLLGETSHVTYLILFSIVYDHLLFAPLAQLLCAGESARLHALVLSQVCSPDLLESLGVARVCLVPAGLEVIIIRLRQPKVLDMHGLCRGESVP